ncbi:MAG TPA: rhodanese-like domain-containing protein [Gemmatimonadaceae bacterium]|nr:rhodanese-like domain-containing protein [Gemmatimonadaceae bacterium]
MLHIILLALATTSDSVLVSAEWLERNASRKDIVIVQVGWDARAYRAGHIPGARFLPMESFAEMHGELHVELPSVSRIEAVLEQIGISDRSRVILYGPPVPVSRLFMTFEAVGLGDRVSVLDGGIEAWKAAGGKVTAEERAVERGDVTLNPRNVFVDAKWIAANKAKPGVKVIDARATRFYTGEDDGQQPRGGRIPGAASIPYTTITNDASDFVDRQEMARQFSAAGVKSKDVVVTYCHIGMQASVLYLAARALGHQARLYDGSFQDWSSRSELPVTTGSQR